MYSINKIKNAGKNLVINPYDDESLNILSYWRATHEKSLSKAFNIVEKEMKRIDKDFLIAKRLKRTPSILTKLKRFPESMQLTTMQDIGGCRIVVKNLLTVEKIVAKLVDRELFILRNNYILFPKADGYRSVHLVGKITAGDITRSIELQVRTKTQHSWATAVEIVDIFTKQNIKHNKGNYDWSNFFKHSSIAFSFLELCFNDIYGVLQNKDSKVTANEFKKIRKNFTDEIYISMEKIYHYATTLAVLDKFNAFAITINKSEEIKNNNGYILIRIYNDSQGKFTLSYKFYFKEEYEEAEKTYLNLEKTNKEDTIALIATSKIGGIQEAYPNYFADSTIFISLIKLLIELYEDIKKTKKNHEVLLVEVDKNSNFAAKYL